jgi:putative ABC transport system permease protein
MSLWSRFANIFRGERLSREIDEELQSHLDEAIEHGRDPEEARRAFGPALRPREESRDIRIVAWLDSLRADAIFGWRQLKKNKATTAVAILSLALAIGSCTAAFRLIDALLLRPLPVAHPERLYMAGRQGIDPGGNFRVGESWEYPLFRQMRAAVKDRAELIAISYADRVDLTYASDQEMEKAYRQYVSGWMFGALGLQPAAGRLFTENDDQKPGAHPYAVLSYDYWTHRFGQDPKAIGRKFRMGNDLYEIAGVASPRFTGTEPGTIVDIFVPTMMNVFSINRSDSSWFRTLAVLKPGVAIEPVRLKLNAITRAFDEERAKGWKVPTKQFIDLFLNQTVLLEPAAAGVSGMQRNYRLSLIALGVLVALVLLIACANVANLLTAQAAARAREMALRVSLGAGRWRLVQLVLVESAWLALLAAAIGAVFAWWAAPFIVGMINPPDNPARLILSADWRLFGFGLGLALGVTLLFGLAPALRASAVKPASALKGGEDPHSRRLLMYALVATQVSFCFIVHFAAGLFVATFDRLANQPTGFSANRLLTLDTIAARPAPPAFWDQVAEHLRETPGVESVALAGWPLLSGNGWNGFIWVNGTPTEVLAYFLNVSPGWIDTMKIPLIEGRYLRANESYPSVAMVNEAFVKQCFGGQNPIGKWFEKEHGDGITRTRIQVVGVVRDARYRNMREPITPTAYVPFHSIDGSGVLQSRNRAAFIVRTASYNPMALAPILRQEVPRARPEFRVSNIRTQQELIDQHTVRERLLAMLALFFAGVALLLAGIGLYGVLDYSVLQRRREIGIRIAIGAPAGDIARRVTVEIFSMVLVGALVGLALGMVSVRYIGTLLYQVKPSNPAILVLPSLTILAAALLAALPAVIRALRIDPVAMLRAE